MLIRDDNMCRKQVIYPVQLLLIVVAWQYDSTVFDEPDLMRISQAAAVLYIFTC